MDEQEGMLEDALARQKRAEEAAALALEQLEQERSVAVAARERSKSAAADGLADREEKAGLKAQLASLRAEVSSLRAAAKVGTVTLVPYPLDMIYIFRCLGHLEMLLPSEKAAQ